MIRRGVESSNFLLAALRWLPSFLLVTFRRIFIQAFSLGLNAIVFPGKQTKECPRSCKRPVLEMWFRSIVRL
uniref:Secreted protein n=1 Tax=Steinernema glaseri TaxID=37863 RepID=A0A1I8AAV4_9BILA